MQIFLHLIGNAANEDKIPQFFGISRMKDYAKEKQAFALNLALFCQVIDAENAIPPTTRFFKHLIAPR